MLKALYPGEGLQVEDIWTLQKVRCVLCTISPPWTDKVISTPQPIGHRAPLSSLNYQRRPKISHRYLDYIRFAIFILKNLTKMSKTRSSIHMTLLVSVRPKGRVGGHYSVRSLLTSIVRVQSTGYHLYRAPSALPYQRFVSTSLEHA